MERTEGCVLGKERVELSEEKRVKESHESAPTKERRKDLEENAKACKAHLLREGEPKEVSSGHPKTLQTSVGPIDTLLLCEGHKVGSSGHPKTV